MRERVMLVTAVLCSVALSSCTNTSEDAVKPLMGLDWFTEYDTVKQSMEGYTLLEERESEGAVTQLMQDYENVELFDYNCDLTLCFTDSGLIGLNYHDVQRNQSYKDWYSTLEATYGLPTEEGSGMASWYDDPAGKDTAIYLFNLEEGVQVSIYATADSPDKSYDKDMPVPTPEIRTPVVPVTEESSVQTTFAAASDESDEPIVTTTARVYREGDIDVIGTDAVGNYIVAVTDPIGEIVTDRAGETVTTIIPATTVAADKNGKPLSTAKTTSKGETTSQTTTTATAAAEESTEPVTEPPIDHTQTFLLNGLQFYGSPTSQRSKMSAYTQLYEYRTEEPGQPWELIMEYENVPYEGKNCDAVLCFTSLGLVGVNYFDSNADDYNYWVRTLTDIYGSPDEMQYDYTAWSSSPVGSGTMIYVFALEDGVQISFFADDTGSELA
ncbi:MAG: hypothetical protein IJ874_03065 [Ruminococcus sp.]|nr:hypothetical protein [Ruminococcus sp.]